MTIKDLEKVIQQIENFGFKANSKNINGFRPHFRKGNDVLFLIGSDFWISKIVKIDKAFHNCGHRVYGVLTDEAPFPAEYDWVSYQNLDLIKFAPLSKAEWNFDGSKIEYTEIDSI